MRGCGALMRLGAHMWRELVPGLRCEAAVRSAALYSHHTMQARDGINQQQGGAVSSKPAMQAPVRAQVGPTAPQCLQLSQWRSFSSGHQPLTATSVSDLRSTLKALDSSGKHPLSPSPAEAKQRHALCDQAAAGLQQCGHELPASELADLGPLLLQTSFAVNSSYTSRPSLTPLTDAMVSAARSAPAKVNARIQDWSPLLQCLTKEGVCTPALHDLMAYAAHRMPPEVWAACASQPYPSRSVSQLMLAYARVGYKGDVIALVSGVRSAMAAGAYAAANTYHCSNLVWALGKLGCCVDQPDTLAVVQLVVQAWGQAVPLDRMPRISPKIWSDLLWGLAKLGCTAAPGSLPDISPVVASMVQHVQQGGMQPATPQEWSNLLWALAKVNADKNTVQPVLDMGVPIITHMAHSGRCASEDITQVAYVLVHYRMHEAKEYFLAGLSNEQCARYLARPVQDPPL